MAVGKRVVATVLAVLVLGGLCALVAYHGRWAGWVDSTTDTADSVPQPVMSVADADVPAIEAKTPASRSGSSSLRNPRELRRVPELTGRSMSIARQLLRLADLEVTEGVYFIADQSWRDDIRPGVVYLQSPPASTPIWAGQTVACWTFVKAEPSRRVVQVPNLREKTATAAAEELNAAELLVLPDVLVETNAVGRTDLVRDQYPKPGQVVMVGTSVLLRYAKTSPEQRRW
jgi:hypothetical protein